MLEECPHENCGYCLAWLSGFKERMRNFDIVSFVENLGDYEDVEMAIKLFIKRKWLVNERGRALQQKDSLLSLVGQMSKL